MSHAQHKNSHQQHAQRLQAEHKNESNTEHSRAARKSLQWTQTADTVAAIAMDQCTCNTNCALKWTSRASLTRVGSLVLNRSRLSNFPRLCRRLGRHARARAPSGASHKTCPSLFSMREGGLVLHSSGETAIARSERGVFQARLENMTRHEQPTRSCRHKTDNFLLSSRWSRAQAIGNRPTAARSSRRIGPHSGHA